MNDFRESNSETHDPTSNHPEILAAPPAFPEVTTDPQGTQRVAPAWHTIVLVVVLLGFSLAGANSQHQFATHHGRTILYAMTIIWEWLIVGFIAWGLRRSRANLGAEHPRRMRLRDLAGGRWNAASEILADVGIAVAFWVAALVVLAILGTAMGLSNPHQVSEAKQKLGFLVPRGHLEIALFLCLTATAGFCEEIIFRGYLQRQFAALTGSSIGGLILQAIVFGAGHAYEGRARMILIAVYGAMFGALALARNSLRPGMLAHFLHDASAGLALQRLLR